MSDKKTLTISLSGETGCGKEKMYDLLHYLLFIAEIECVPMHGGPLIELNNDQGEALLEWFEKNVKVVLLDYRA